MDLTADQFKGILDSAIVAISRFRCFPDQRREILYWSAGTEYLLGFTAAELMSDERLWSSRIPAEDWQEKILPLFQTIASQPITRFEYRFHHRDGSLRWIAATQTTQYEPASNSWIVTVVGHDITTHKQLEAELADRETQLRYRERQFMEAQRVAGVGSWEFELSSQKISWSEGLFRIFGLDPEQPEPDYATYLQLLHPDDVDLLQQSINRAIQTGVPYTIELRHFHSDGSYRYQEGRGEPVFDAEGRVIRLIGTAMDITDRKLTELALRESEQRYMTLTEIAPVGIFRTDLQGDCLYVNPKWCEMAGRTATEVQGPNWQQVLVPEDRDRITTEWYQAVQENRPFYGEYCFQKPDGTLTWLVAQAVAERDLQGQVTGYVGTLTDISERKRAETELQQTHENLEAIFAAFPDLFFRLDSEGTFLDYRVGQNYLSDLYIPPQEFLGRSLQEVLPPDLAQPFKQLIHQALETESIVGTEYLMTLAGGEQYYEARLVPLSGDQLIGIVRNISERKQQEAERHAAELSLQQAYQQINSLIKNMPLGTVIWDEQFRIQRWSEQAVAIFGWSETEVIGKTMLEWQFIFEPDLESVVQEGERLLVGGGSGVCSNRNYRKDGRVINCEWFNSALVDESGKLIAILSMVQDVTYRKQADLALRTAKERYSLATRAARVGVWEWNLKTNDIYIDPNIKALAGYADTEFPNDIEHWLLLAHPDDRQRILATAQDYLNGTLAQFVLEHRLLHRDGSIVWVLVRGELLRDQHGQPERLIGTDTDITERKVAEQSLRESEERFRLLAEHLRDSFFICTPTLDRYLYVSPAVETIWGITPEQLYANPRVWLERVHPEDWDYFIANTPLDSLATDYDLEYRIIRPDGDVRWVHIRSYPLVDSQGQVNRIIGVCEDITDRKTAEVKIRQSEEQLRLSLEFTGIGAWSWHPGTGEYFWTGQMAELLELPPGLENMYQIWHDRIHPADVDRVEAGLQSALATGGLFAEEYRYFLQDGRTVWRSVKGQGVYTETGDVERVLGVVVDITEQKSIEMSLRQSEARFREIAQTISQIFFIESLFTGEYLYISPAYETIWGRSCESLYADPKSWLESVHPDDYAYVVESLAGQFAGRSFVEREYRIIRSDGEIRWIFAQLTMVRDEAGHAIHCIGTAADISDRKIAELALQKSEARLKESQRIAKLGGWEIDLQSGEQYWSEEVYNIHELNIDDEYPNCLENPDYYINFYAPDAQPIIRATFQNAIQLGEAYDLEVPFITAKGNHRWVKSIGQPIIVNGTVTHISGILQDITDRKQLELSLQASEQKLTQILNRTVASVSSFRVFANQDWEYEYFSAGCEQLFGYGSQELIVDKMLWMSRVFPQDLETILQPIFAQFRDGKNLAAEYRFYHKDGSLRWISSVYTSEQIEPGCWRITALCQDVTHRKTAEIALQESDTRLRLALDVSNAIAWERDLQTDQLLFTSTTTLSHPQRIPYAKAMELVHPEDQERLHQANQAAIAQRGTFQIEHRVATPGQMPEWRWVQVSARVLTDNLGNPTQLVGMSVDITDRKLAEIALQESEAKFRRLTENVPGMIYRYVVHPDGRDAFTYVSPHCQEIYELDAETILQDSRVLWAMVDPEDVPSLQASIAASAQDLRPFFNEHRLHTPSGIKWVQVLASPERSENGALFWDGLIIDVTAHKQLETALRESEARRRLALELTETGSWEFDVATGEAIWSDSHYRLMGLTPNEQPSNYQTWRDRVHPDDLDWVEAAFNQSLATRTPLDVEYRVVYPHGTVRWVLTKGQGVYDASGQALRMLGVMMDISDRKIAEAALQEKQQQLTSLLNNIPHIAWLKDRDGRFLAVNEPFAQACGYAASQIVGLTDCDIWSPELAEAYRQDDREVMASRQQKCVEEPLLTATGIQQWIETIKTPILNEQGEPIGTAGIALDITERKRIERTLQQMNEELEQRVQQRTQELVRSEQDLRTIFNNVYDAILIHNMDGTILDANDRAIDLFAAPPDQLLGLQVYDLCASDFPPEVFTRNLQRVQAGETLQFEGQGRRLDNNTTFDTETSVRLVSLSDRPVLLSGVRDISDRKRAERALRKSERRYATLAAAAPTAIFCFDQPFNCTYVNQRWSEITGRPLESALGRGWLDTAHPEDRELMVKVYAEEFAQMASGQKLLSTGEGRMLRPDGSVVWFYAQVAPEIDLDGSVVGYIGTLTDITARKQAESELAESEAKFRRLVEGANDLIWAGDVEGRFTYLSPQFKTLFGWEASEWIGQPFFELIHPDDRSLLGADHWQESEPNQKVGHREFRHRHRQGHYLWVTSSATPILDPKGTFIGFQGILSDISDRKAAEAELRASQARLRATFEQAAVGIVQVSLEGRFIQVNQKLCEIVGYTASELLNKTYADITHPEDVEISHEQVRHLLAGDQSAFILEKRYIRKDGELVWANVSVSLVYGSAGQPDYFIAVIEDITERIRLEQERNQSQQKLRAESLRLQLALEAAEMGTWECCLETGEIFWSEPVEAMFGFAPGTFPGHREAFIERLYPADRDRVLAAITHTFATQTPYSIEYRIQRPDGTLRWLAAWGKVISLDSGLRMVGVAADITDRKQAEESLRLSQEQLQLALESAGDGLWDWNVSTGAAYLSPRWLAILGYDVGDWPGHVDTWERLLHPDDRARMLALLNANLQDGSVPYQVEYRALAKSGEWRWVANYGKVVERDQFGQPLRMVGLIQDITDRKQTEQDLQESRNMLRLVLDTIPQRVFWKDWQSRFLGCNSAFANDYCLTIEEIIGKTDLELPWAAWADLYQADDARVMQTRTPKLNYEEPTCNMRGEPIWIRTSKIPLTNSQGEVIGILGCYDDITELKFAEQQLQSERLRLELALEAADMGTWESNLDMGLWSERTEAIFGYAPGTFPGDREAFLRLIHPDDQERVFAALSRSFTTRSPYSVEYRIHRLDGQLRWVAVNGKVVETEDGTGLRIVGVALDITERKQAEATLRDSEERLRLALTASNQGLYDLNIQTGQAIVTPEYATMLGYDPATFEETNARWLQRLHPDDVERLTATYRAYIAGEIPDYQVEFRQRTSDGQWKWILSVGKIVAWDEVGQPLRMLGTHTDIDDRKQAEADLLKSQALLVEAQRMARMGNWEFNPITQEIYWTEEEYRLFNLDPSQPEPSYATLASLYHPEDWAVLQVAVEQAITTGDPYKLILRTAPSGPEGSVRYLETIGQVERDSLGQVVRLYGTCQDITDRRLSELALQESEERFRQLAESITQVFWLTNGDHSEILYVSPAYEQVWGYSLASLHESPSQWFECIHPEDQEGVSQAMLLLTQGNYQMEYRIRRADGQLRWIRDRSFPVYNEAGDVYRIAGIAEDITERKQAELALAENNIILQSVIDSTPDVVFVKDLQGRTVIVNDAFADFFNRPKAELLGKADAELWPTEMVTHIQEIDSRIMALGRAETFEEPVPAPEGVRTYLTTKFPWRNSHGDVIGLIGMSRDITERKQAEEQIQASLRQKELLLREIHHRIKNNLQVVSSLLMLQADTTDDPYTQKVLQDSQERVAAIALVHEALYRSADLERIDLSEYVQDLLEQIFYSYQGSERGIVLQLELEPIWLNLETVLPCALILNELLVNALKHGFPDQRSGQISVSLNCYEQMITLSVADDGIGLPPDLDCRQSSSLGLQLVHDLTEQLDGSLTIASAQSHPQGTCFTIRFQELFYRRRV
uniref:histidine kinase n=1 Tax=Cyanothece sp. (strain PCC 7425 / ATCC 29141) TaxID=395961 RepID=B8HWB5_CYAP4